jgi:hypothetical protein
MPRINGLSRVPFSGNKFRKFLNVLRLLPPWSIPAKTLTCFCKRPPSTHVLGSRWAILPYTVIVNAKSRRAYAPEDLVHDSLPT